jgi:hypothetical protein
MSDLKTERIERIVDAAASALWAAAAGYCAFRISSAIVAGPVVVVALCCCFALLRAVRPEEQHFALSDYVPGDIPCAPPQLLLTHESHGIEQTAPERNELVLDDVLAELASDSRVVQLFDRAAMPTPGELRARIDRHLDSHVGTGRVSAAPPDASQALHEALAELRRSIR